MSTLTNTHSVNHRFLNTHIGVHDVGLHSVALAIDCAGLEKKMMYSVSPPQFCSHFYCDTIRNIHFGCFKGAPYGVLFAKGSASVLILR